MEATLSQGLRAATRELHVQAERAGVMGALLKGRLDRGAYVALLSSLHAIYGGLEDALDRNAEHPAIAPLPLGGLARRGALQHDLAALNGPSWRSDAPPHPLAREYAAHLRALGDTAPERLLAHAWLRYLGDLNGGQIVGRIVRESLRLAPEASTFYEFPSLPDPMAAAAAWRAALDAVPLSERERSAVIAEACAGFQRHIALFEALAGAQDAAPSTPSA